VSSNLCISIRFADPTFRGRGDGGEPEWPPSPLRVFQALVAAAAARYGNPDRFRDYAAPAFAWLGGLRAPLVIAPQGDPSVPFRAAVPNNDMDVIAADWARGNEPRRQPAALKTMKQVRPTHMRDGEEFPAVHYVWSIPEAEQGACERHKESLFAAARSIVALGWGVDMAVGCGRMLDDAGVGELKGARWNPAPEGRSRLRVPVAGTFDDLVRRHRDFLNRLPPTGGFVPVPPLTAFETVGYRRDTDPVERPVIAFELHRPIAELAELVGRSKFRPFDPVRTPDFARGGPHAACGAVVVAGLVRHAAAEVAREQGWDDERVKSFICGHGDGRGGQATTDERLMYLPLPSIEFRGDRGQHVGAIRRVLIAGPPGEDLSRLRQLLNGRELLPAGGTDPVAMLAVGSTSDKVVAPYLRASRAWSTVTPVALPGFDDPDGIRRRLSERDGKRAMSASEKSNQLSALNRRTRDLLLKAFAQAGIGDGLLSEEKLESGEAELSWRGVAFRAGSDLARRYQLGTPAYPRYHVRVVFPRAVRGPLAVGAGRYRGLGLFASEDP
jgi:CRISPR-associated protein Csb2